MRLWTVHPGVLDRAGLVACWREGLLALAVLRGRTRGYRRHPQLDRWRACRRPVASLAAYLHGLADEADRRGYRFDRAKLPPRRAVPRLVETRGQAACEWRHLLAKLRRRSPATARLMTGRRLRVHPLFRLVAGGVRPWERARP